MAKAATKAKKAKAAKAEPKLTPKQALFVNEYLVDLNATQAAIRAGYSPKTANEQASRLLANVNVAAEVEKRRASIADKLEITQEKVLQRMWDIATADPNKIIQFRRTCCRYCHGKDHRFQWRDKEEFALALLRYDSKDEKDENPLDPKPKEPPTNDGGYGYKRLADPHPDCPQCDGEGLADIHATDTRKLDPASLALYAGAKVTQSGFEIKLHDQGKALENVARHLGMFKDKIEIEVSDLVGELERARRRAAGQ